MIKVCITLIAATTSGGSKASVSLVSQAASAKRRVDYEDSYSTEDPNDDVSRL